MARKHDLLTKLMPESMISEMSKLEETYQERDIFNNRLHTHKEYNAYWSGIRDLWDLLQKKKLASFNEASRSHIDQD